MNNNKFTTIIGEGDATINPKDVKKVVITYGQAYFSALEKRTELKRKVIDLITLGRGISASWTVGSIQLLEFEGSGGAVSKRERIRMVPGGA